MWYCEMVNDTIFSFAMDDILPYMGVWVKALWAIMNKGLQFPGRVFTISKAAFESIPKGGLRRKRLLVCFVFYGTNPAIA